MIFCVTELKKSIRDFVGIRIWLVPEMRLFFPLKKSIRVFSKKLNKTSETGFLSRRLTRIRFFYIKIDLTEENRTIMITSECVSRNSPIYLLLKNRAESRGGGGQLFSNAKVLFWMNKIALPLKRVGNLKSCLSLQWSNFSATEIGRNFDMKIIHFLSWVDKFLFLKNKYDFLFSRKMAPFFLI